MGDRRLGRPSNQPHDWVQPLSVGTYICRSLAFRGTINRLGPSTSSFATAAGAGTSVPIFFQRDAERVTRLTRQRAADRRKMDYIGPKRSSGAVIAVRIFWPLCSRIELRPRKGEPLRSTHTWQCFEGSVVENIVSLFWNWSSSHWWTIHTDVDFCILTVGRN